MKYTKIVASLLLGAALLFTGCNNKEEKKESATTTVETKQVTTTAKSDAQSSANESIKTAEKKVAPSAINTDIMVYTADNSDGKITTESIEKAFTKVGFYVSANNDMNFPYKRDFNNTNYDVYNLAAFYNKEIVAMFIKEYPRIGLFAPMSMSIYTKKGDKTISLSVLSPARMAKITGIPADHPGWKKLDELLTAAFKEALPNGKLVTLNNPSVPVEAPLIAEYSFAMGEDWEDKKEDFENDFESALTPAGFAMPAFNELSDEIDDIGYDFYEVYSICKIPVIYTVSKEHPEAGAYAPCSMYVYKKVDEEKVHMGFPSVYNWFASMGVNEESKKGSFRCSRKV